jgi:hypothetical protein
MKRVILALALLAGCDNPVAPPTPATPAPDPAPPVVESGNLPAKHMLSEAIESPPQVQFNGPRVGDIAVGTSVWIRPWTVWVDAEQDAFLNGFHTFSDKAEDPSWVRAERAADGWTIHLEGSQYQWTPMYVEPSPGGYDSQPVKRFVARK